MRGTSNEIEMNEGVNVGIFALKVKNLRYKNIINADQMIRIMEDIDRLGQESIDEFFPDGENFNIHALGLESDEPELDMLRYCGPVNLTEVIHTSEGDITINRPNGSVEVPSALEEHIDDMLKVDQPVNVGGCNLNKHGEKLIELINNPEINILSKKKKISQLIKGAADARMMSMRVADLFTDGYNPPANTVSLEDKFRYLVEITSLGEPQSAESIMNVIGDVTIAKLRA